jgi:hypothetical protein
MAKNQRNSEHRSAQATQLSMNARVKDGME